MYKAANGGSIMSSNVGLCRRHKVTSHWLLVVVIVTTLTCSALLPLTTALTLDEFYPFDVTYDNKTEEKDDGGSPLITLDVDFPFFNTTDYRNIYVNNNGIVSFVEKLVTYKPMNFDNSKFENAIPLIAPFWADVDVQNVVGQNETIVYRLTKESSVLRRASHDVRRFFIGQGNFNASVVLIVTWYQVGFYGAADEGKNKRNTFQAVLVTDSHSSYAIFNYNKTVWTTGSNSGGETATGLGGTPAVVGFHSGGEHYYLIENSGSDAIVNITTGSNIDTPGKYMFKIDGGVINDLQCAASDKLTITPASTSMLGSEALVVSGPCLSPGQAVKARIRELNLEFPCVVNFDLKAICVTPSLFRTGELTFELDSTGMGWNYSTTITSVHVLDMTTVLERQNVEDWRVGEGWWRVNVSKQIHQERQLVLMSYSDNNGLQPNLTTVKSLNVERGQDTRRFKVDSIDDSQDTLVIKLCWIISPDVSPVCIWSDIFPVRWKQSQQPARSEQWCENWLGHDKQLKPINIRTPFCPCIAAIAENDVGHFRKTLICDSSKSSVNYCTYYPNAHKCFRRNIKSSDDSGETCCYNHRGDLMDIREDVGAGTLQRYHENAQGDTIVPYFSYFQADFLPRLHCCQYSDKNCNEFIVRRNATTCQGYSPPSPALAAGDPHIVTLDGKEFSFNGEGDFYLVYDEITSTAIQVRAVRAVDQNSHVQNATVFSNVAVAVPGSSDTIEIRQQTDGEVPYQVLVNKQPITSTPLSTSQFKNISLSHNDSGNFLIVLEPVSVSVTVEATLDLLNIIVLIGEDSMKGTLRGLLGNYNGNADDDLIPRYGPAIPADSSMRDIHFKFGITWNVSSSESILSDSFRDLQVSEYEPFQPYFIDELESRNNETDRICGGNKQCEFDLAVTGKESIATSTKQFSTKFEETKSQLAQNVVRCPYLEIPANGNKTSNGSSEYDRAVFTCNQGYEMTPSGTGIRVCQSDSTWSGSYVMCPKKVTPPEDGTSFYIIIGAATGSGVFAIVIVAMVSVYIKRRCLHKKPQPTMISISLTDVRGPVFGDATFMSKLESLSGDGRFNIPRPTYVDPQIFSDYF